MSAQTSKTYGPGADLEFSLDAALTSLLEAAPAGALNGAGIKTYMGHFKEIRDRAISEKNHRVALHAALICSGLMYTAQHNKIGTGA